MIKFDKIGSDPEFGVIKDGQMLPSYMFINGKKNEPEEIENGFFLQKDNLLLEGNIPPSSSKGEFIESMKFLKMLANTIVSQKGAELICGDLFEYDDEFIQTEDGQTFGCSGADHTYSQMSHRTPKLRGNKRPVGGHIHLGYEIVTDKYDHEDLNYALAKAWDYFVTMPSDKVLYTKERRESYGITGGFRHTRYGLEFRSLGGHFMKDEYLEWIYNQTMKVVDFVSIESNYKKLLLVKSCDEKYYKLLNINLDEQIPSTVKTKELQA